MKLTIMKHISFILICLFSFIGCSITKPSVTATKAPLMIINGSFFRGYPEKSPVNRLFWQGLMKDEVYGTILVEEHDTPLSKEALAYAVPIEEIENGETILTRSKSIRMVPCEIISNLKIKIGDEFPEFCERDMKGKVWNKEKFKGKKVLINFWYSGCGPCRREMPEMGTWVRKHRDFLFVAATYEDDALVQKIVKEHKFRFHQLIGTTELNETVGVGCYPLTIILNEEGKVVLIEEGTTPVQWQRIMNVLNK